MNRSKVKDLLLTGINLSRYTIIIAILFLIGGCHFSDKDKDKDKDKARSRELFGKIIYDTYIVNRDSTDSWGDECLSNFNRKALIDKIFNAILAEIITPYDYFTGKKITIEQIKRMETEGVFSREKISKIQFEEQWIWDNEKVEMQKKMISMTIAYEVYDIVGKPRGHKPIFKIVFGN